MSILNETEDATTDIPLADPVETESESPAPAVAFTSAFDPEEDDGEVNDLLNELKEPSETDVAVSQLRESTTKLSSALKSVGSEIDSRLGISQVDSQLGVSKTVSSTASSIGNLWNSLQIGDKAQNLMKQESVKNVSSTISDTLEKTGVKSVFAKGTRGVQNLNEEHKISTKVVGTAASGIGWVANALGGTSTSTDSDTQ